MVLIATMAICQDNKKQDTVRKPAVRLILPTDIPVSDTTFIPMRLNNVQLKYLKNLVGEQKINDALGLWMYLDELFEKSKNLYQRAEAARMNAGPPK